MHLSIIENGQKIESTIDLSNLLAELKRYWLKVALIVIILTAVAFPLINLLTPYYMSTATLLIKGQADNATPIVQVNEYDSTRQRYLPTQSELIGAQQVLANAVIALGLNNESDFNGELDAKHIQPISKQQKIDNAVATIRKKLLINEVRGTQLVHISYESPSPAKAESVANAVAYAFIGLQIEQKKAKTRDSQQWNEKQLIILKQKITEDGIKMDDFLRNNGLLTFRGVDGYETEELGILTNKLADAKDYRLSVKADYDTIKESAGHSLNEVATLPKLSNHPQLQDLRIAYIKAQEQVNELKNKYGPKYLGLREAESKLSAVEQQTTSLLEELRQGLYKDYQSALKKEQQYRLLVALQKKDFMHLSKLKDQYELMQTELNKTTDLYKSVYQRNQEQLLTATYEEADAELIDSALLPIDPIKPNKILLLAMVFILSLIFCLIFIIVKLALNNTVNNITQVTTRLGLTAIGELQPVFEKIPRKQYCDISLKNPLFMECIDAMRTAVLLDKTKWQSLAIASTDEKEERCVVSYLLASSFAKYQKTILVDVNYREDNALSSWLFESTLQTEIALKPHDAKSDLDSIEKRGVAEILAGSASLNQTVIELDNGLHFLARGQLTESSSLTLSSEHLQALLAQLNAQYERVIIDLPNLEQSKDAFLVSRYIQGVLYVSRSHYLSANKILSHLNKLRKNNNKIIAGILTQVDEQNVQSIEGLNLLAESSEQLLTDNK